ncbi:MAG: NifB/NifX family molybdenum-iron cluster-binding protein [Anaerolineae bacterium]|jgi:predicted Fe-Mo cluster-binding NifX family protein
MRIVVTADGAGLDASASPVFGRCPAYVFVDTESMAFDVVQNPAVGAAGGAGIQAAQLIVQGGAEALITGSVGPNAFDVLQSAGVGIYRFGGGTVREAVEAFKAGALQPSGDASAQAGMGMAYGQGRGTGYGLGHGMGRGRGMGMGRGRGRGMAAPAATPPQSPAPPPAAPASSRDGEIATLRQMAQDLRRQLAAVLDNLERLEGRHGTYRRLE